MITISHTPIYSTVTNTSQQLTLPADERYLITVSTNCWIKQGANPTAAAGVAGNLYLPANTAIVVSAGAGNVKLAVIRDSVDGHITATRTL